MKGDRPCEPVGNHLRDRVSQGVNELDHSSRSVIRYSGISERRRLLDHEGVDFTSAVRQVLAAMDDSARPYQSMAIEEVDHDLGRVVSTCTFSSHELQRSVRDGRHEFKRRTCPPNASFSVV
jgi:hypothetical protein